MRGINQFNPGAVVCLLAVCLQAGPVSSTAAATGCGNELLGAGFHRFDFQGVARTFRLTLPPEAQQGQPLPLILLFHGWGGDEQEFLRFDSVVAASGQQGFAVVAPRGLGSGAPDQQLNSWTFSGSDTGLDGSGGPICDYGMTNDYSYASCAEIKANSCSWTQCQQDDVAFTLALLDHLDSHLCLDSERIYATGGSNGGMFTWELAQNPASADRLRAIAPIIGMPHRGYKAGPGRDGALPALLITGLQDTTSPPGQWGEMGFTTTSNGTDRYYYESASAITSSWAAAHGCPLTDDASLVQTRWDDVECRSFCESNTGLPPVLDCRADVGHTYELAWAWPLVLQFFTDHGGEATR